MRDVGLRPGDSAQVGAGPMRRALDETMADLRFEASRARSLSGWATWAVRSLAAIARVLVTSLGIFDEGYPMRHLGTDLRYGLRRLRAAPGYALFSVFTLALGIGVTAAAVSLVRGATGPPPGVRDPTTLINLYHSRGAELPFLELSWPDYQDFKAKQTSFEAVTAWTIAKPVLTAEGRSDSGMSELVDGSYFPVLGVQPALGRVLEPADDRPGATAVAVISDRTWHRIYDGAPDVVGRTLLMNGHAFEVVGVTPPGFAGIFNNGLVPTPAWIPLQTAPLVAPSGHDSMLGDDREDRRLLVKGRLKPARTFAEAQAEISLIARQLDVAYPIGAKSVGGNWVHSPGETSRPWKLERVSDVVLNEGMGFLVKPVAALLLAAVGLVLLVACTNLANLALARASSRRQDVAVRLALGAPRWRLIREALTESLCVALAGSLLAALVARFLIVRLSGDLDIGDLVLHLDPSFDAGVWLASIGAAVLAFGVAGVWPAWQSTRADLRTALGGEAAGTAGPRWRTRRGLIALQVSVSLALLSIASVAGSQFREGLTHDTGIALDHLAVAELDLSRQGYDEARGRRAIETVMALLPGQAGVESAALSSGLPFGTSNPGCATTTPDRPLVPMKFYGQHAEYLAVSPGVFKTWGVRILRGRAFTDHDAAGGQLVAVVSDLEAKRLFASTDAVGQVIQIQRSRWRDETDSPVVNLTVVGIASDTDSAAVGTRRQGSVYVPFAQHYEPDVVFSVRTVGAPVDGVTALRGAIGATNRALVAAPVGEALLVTGARNLFLQVTADMAGLLGVFALALALAGLYGALSHIVAGRTRELGIRVSLGASGRRIARMVVADGMRPVGLGIVIGLVLGTLAKMAVRPIFAHLVPSLDPFVLAVAPLTMLLAGALACYLPARRAAHVDPNVALRNL